MDLAVAARKASRIGRVRPGVWLRATICPQTSAMKELTTRILPSNRSGSSSRSRDQRLPPGAGRQPLDAMSKFGQGHDAQEDAIFVGLSQPRDYAGIGARLHPLGNDRGIEQKVHNLILRGISSERSIERPDPRKGDEAKNSARFPVRFVFRFHSRRRRPRRQVPFFVWLAGLRLRFRDDLAELGFCFSDSPRWFFHGLW